MATQTGTQMATEGLYPREVLKILTAFKKGDFSARMPIDKTGIAGKIADTLNDTIELAQRMAGEFDRVSIAAGKEGKTAQRAALPDAAGGWAECIGSVNTLASDLVQPTNEIARVIGAVARGDLSQSMSLEMDGRPLKGDFLRTAKVVNGMVEQLGSFASEVTRMARELGTEGKLEAQAEVKDVAGVWKDLTDNVNSMAANLTGQVRNIAQVTAAVAKGDLTRKITVDARGEILELKGTFNGMIDTLATFAQQVTSVAREVGIEGRLGGQANVPGAAGTWKDLTENVNQLAANLTTQVRAIAEVSTAVTKGDLSRSITVEARGEMSQLKDNINEMIRNLRETTRINTEQDWLKTNLAKLTRMLQGQRDLLTVSRSLLSELAPLAAVQHGVFYIAETQDSGRLKLLASYGYKERKNVSNEFSPGEGLVGQCAFEKQRILLTNVPGDYIEISSGLGQAKPLNIIVLPVLFEGKVKAVMELASFERFSPTHQAFLDQLAESLGIVLNTIEASSRTEDLLKQSQSLAKELQNQQEELQQTNEELELKARALVEQKVEVERKNTEIEQARRSLQEKAEQLALTSKHKSEFLANMSHELRTPLNSLLILAKELGDNPEGNLTDKQVEYSKTIHSSGVDLLTLINDILDLAKIESGTVTVEVGEVRFAEVATHIERTFRHAADGKGLEYAVALDANLPASICTDEKRLEQVLQNLLSNAFKFTSQGHVGLRIAPAGGGWSADHKVLNRAQGVVAFAIADTGIGIAPEKQRIIFEAFQQADGSTSRQYGGTGLGLAISREVARLLGGEIRLASTPGEGSTFTLYLPLTYLPPVTGPSHGSLGRGSGTGPGTQAPGPEDPCRAAPVFPGRPLQQVSGTPPDEIHDDRGEIQPGDRVLLIAEDDRNFAQLLLGMAREKGFKCLVATRGDTALTLARKFKPDAIILDIRLPDVDGWTVLDRLKLDPNTRHVPVQIITVEEERERGLQRGAFAYLQKPVDKQTLADAFARIRSFIERRVKNLLVVEDDEAQRKSIVELIGNDDVLTTAVGTGTEALAALKAHHFDCMVLDLILPDMSGLQLLDAMQESPALRDVPVIVYTAKELTPNQETKLKKAAKGIIVKGVRSPERLVDETALFLHRATARLPENQRRVVEQLYLSDTALAGKKVLIVDDDMRNIFAVTSVLERHSMEVQHAENGKDGIEFLQKTPGIDVVLMDIMMPELDGYEAMRAIRKLPEFKSLPIIALTAKAMKGDRRKCIEAGASDYITKPVDTGQLLSLLRVWLQR